MKQHLCDTTFPRSQRVNQQPPYRFYSLDELQYLEAGGYFSRRSAQTAVRRKGSVGTPAWDLRFAAFRQSATRLMLTASGCSLSTCGFPQAIKSASDAADTSDMSVIPSQTSTISGLLDAAATRHRVTSQNLANVNTPAYRRLDVSFEEQLAERIRAGDVADEIDITPEIVSDDQSPSRADGNNVDIDREIGTLNKNAILYQTYMSVLTTKYSQLRTAISGRS